MKKTILIVENESIIALDEKAVLEAEGYSCVVVYNGEKAVDEIEKDYEINLILMDVDLGSGMDGTQTAEKILAIRDLPIVFISSYTNPDIVRKTERITSYGYIVKDSGPTVLLTSIKMAFRLFNANKQIREQKESLELNQYCLDHTEITVLMLKQDGTIANISDYGAEQLGYQKSELLGKNITLINPSAHPENWDFSEDSYNRMLVFETCHRRKDGSEFPVEINSKNLKVGSNTVAFSLIKDLTREKRAQSILEQSRNEIQMSRAKLKNVIEMAHMGGWELDVEKNIFTFTDELYSLFRTSAAKEGGYFMTPEEYTKRFVHPDDINIVAEETAKAIHTDDPDFHQQLNHKVIFADGETGYITVRFFIVKDENGKTVKTYGANQDITDIVNNELHIEALLKEKEILLKEIQHRVKNNLRTIERPTSLQLAGVKDQAARDTLNEARQRIGIMMNIYKNLSDQNNYQSVNGKLILLETISDITRSYPDFDRIRLETKIENFEIPVSTAINICIIVNELVTNSCKYAFLNLPESGKGIISIEVLHSEDGLLIHVSDNGGGMRSDILDNQKFGLGLSLVKSMTENCDGTLEISSNEGTDVRIFLKKPVY